MVRGMRHRIGAVVVLSLTLAATGYAQSGAESAQTASPTASAPAHSISITEDQNGRTVDVPLGSDVAVKFVASGGTGYGWIMDPLTSAVAVAGRQESAALHPGLPGGPQQTIFHLQVKTAGSVTLHFGLSQPWMKNTPPAKTFTVTLRAS